MTKSSPKQRGVKKVKAWIRFDGWESGNKDFYIYWSKPSSWKIEKGEAFGFKIVPCEITFKP